MIIQSKRKGILINLSGIRKYIMLHWLIKILYKSSLSRKHDPQRFKVRVKGRDEYIVSEGDHKIIIIAELLSGNNGVAIYYSSIDKWLPPHDKAPVHYEDRERILNKFCAYLESRKINYSIHCSRGIHDYIRPKKS